MQIARYLCIRSYIENIAIVKNQNGYEKANFPSGQGLPHFNPTQGAPPPDLEALASSFVSQPWPQAGPGSGLKDLRLFFLPLLVDVQLPQRQQREDWEPQKKQDGCGSRILGRGQYVLQSERPTWSKMSPYFLCTDCNNNE